MTELKERLQSINEFVDMTIAERIGNICETKILNNKNFSEVNSKAIEIYNELNSQLTDDHKKLLRQYSDLLTGVRMIEQEILYKQGLREGLALPKAWGGTK